MSYTNQTRNLLAFLKDLGWSQKRIEQKLKYSDNYISQQVSRDKVTEKMYDRINDLYDDVVNNRVKTIVEGEDPKQSNILAEEDRAYRLQPIRVDREVLANEADIASIQGGIKLNYVIGMIAELQEAILPGKKATEVASRVQELVQFDYQQVVLKMQI